MASNLHEALLPQIPTPKHIDTGPPLGDFQQLPVSILDIIRNYLGFIINAKRTELTDFF